MGKQHKPACRDCGGESTTDDVLICPCKCTDAHKYVHVSCLNKSRANVSDSRNMYKCLWCNTEYKMQLNTTLNDTDRGLVWRKRKFYAYVARDSIAGFLFLFTLIFLLGFMVFVFDASNNFPLLAQATIFLGHERIFYYLCGFLVLCFLLGLFSCCLSCCRSESGNPCPGPTDCDFCARGGAEEVFTFFCLVALFVTVLFGFVYLIGLGTLFLQTSIKRHLYLIELRLIAKDYEVLDVTQLPTEEDVPYAMVVDEVRQII